MRTSTAILIGLGGAAAIGLLRVWGAASGGDAALDGLKPYAVAAALWQWNVKGLLDTRYVHALLAIAKNEDDESQPPEGQLGDYTASGGPSVGPWQVERATAVELGLVPSDISANDYVLLEADLWWCARAAAKVFDSKLSAAGGDWSQALARYNGSGAAAADYSTRALAYANTTWGETFTG